MSKYMQALKKLRKDKEYSQEYIAEVLGTTQQVYSRYETGQNEMPIKHLIRLCKFYKVSSDEVLGLKR